MKHFIIGVIVLFFGTIFTSTASFATETEVSPAPSSETTVEEGQGDELSKINTGDSTIYAEQRFVDEIDTDRLVDYYANNYDKKLPNMMVVEITQEERSAVGSKWEDDDPDAIVKILKDKYDDYFGDSFVHIVVSDGEGSASLFQHVERKNHDTDKMEWVLKGMEITAEAEKSGDINTVIESTLYEHQEDVADKAFWKFIGFSGLGVLVLLMFAPMLIFMSPSY